ncbi:voltage-gated chloride channel [Malaciobacter molluscorum LMG 25693]|uniref:Voltage-gated chloride channel n=1 Tax=Malaciobacter molluscorum LMG 25693 TaxID=870501 RepID=A0A2G1DHI1_9BACT|nr:chloride channel protein [Malaciobacter molluscorum]AXX93313.1 voltage-gated chloride channel [Malaciobacter molluscorum LMG 25693]PHO17969.1 voltage-gated chloride channel [Malaciobacter molluscorum LMG 25693]RXJ95169.1 voltage-gated chloride channel [Malaciobacter molluscorum]
MKKHIIEQLIIFFSVTKWVLLSSFIGVTIGFVITFFLNSIHAAENSRSLLPFHYYYLLPFALMLSVFLVKKFAPNAKGHGTEKVIEAVHKKDGKIEVAVIPVKLVATILTLFAGGSAGKEGPGAQIGAGSASLISDIFKFSKADRKKLVICGISAGFASVFGTPISGAIFGIEVLIVGIIMYDVLLPSFISGFAAYTTAKILGVNYTYFNLHFAQTIPIEITLIFQVIIAGLFFGIVSDFLVTAFKKSDYYIKRIDINLYLKAFLGGLILVILSFFVGDRYFGLGLDTISDILYSDPSVSGIDVPWYSFIMKTIFTSITLSSGGSGGVITPIFYIGATSGHFLGTIFGDHLALFAALGFTSVLAGAANAPIAATIMAVELFGVEIAHYAAISAVISFLITGHRSVYASQILKMKKSDLLSIEFGKNLEHNEINLSEKSKEKIVIMRRKLKNIRRRDNKEED